MPKYFAEKVLGHWLYFTSHCVLEAMHVHASQDGKLREKGSAKFFVYSDGSSRMMSQGTLRDQDVPEIQHADSFLSAGNSYCAAPGAKTISSRSR